IIKTFIIGPLKHASATDVYNVIRDVYRESMNQNSRFGNFVGGVGFFGAAGARIPVQNTDQYGNPKGVTLSVGVDEKTNSVIVACPKGMYEDIKKLVEEIDLAASTSNQVVQVKIVKGIDPSILQDAIDAIQ